MNRRHFLSLLPGLALLGPRLLARKAAQPAPVPERELKLDVTTYQGDFHEWTIDPGYVSSFDEAWARAAQVKPSGDYYLYCGPSFKRILEAMPRQSLLP